MKKFKIGQIYYNRFLNHPFLIETEEEAEIVKKWWHNWFWDMTPKRAVICLESIQEMVGTEILMKNMLIKYLRKHK